MSGRRTGRALAAEHGATLRRFPTLAAAKRALFAERDAALAHPKLASREPTPSSLVDLERELAATKRGRAALERVLGYWLGHVAVASGARWVVERYPFPPAEDAYEIGVAVGTTRLVGLDAMCVGFEPARDGRKLLRHYRDLFPAKAKETPKAARTGGDLEAIVIAALSRKSTPQLRPWELWIAVRHRLKDDAIPEREVKAVIDALTARGVIEPVGVKVRLAASGAR
jgi:hypothetical protein